MVSLDFIVGIIGNIISLLVYAAPLQMFREVVRKKSTGNYDVLPYIATLLCKSLWTFYGALLGPKGLLLVTVNALGVLSESIYVILYLIYAPKDKKVKTLILVAILNLAVVGLVIALATAVFHDERDRHIFMGVLCSAVTIVMYVAPLKVMNVVIKAKSVECMSIFLSFVLLLNAWCWFIFALVLRDFYVIVPNAIGILSSSIQIILYMTYKNKSHFAKSAVVDEKLGSLQDIKENIKIQDVGKGDEAKMENQKITTTISARLYELKPDVLTKNDDEDAQAVGDPS